MNGKERKPEKRRLESKRKKTKNERKKRRIMEEWRMLAVVAVGRNHTLLGNLERSPIYIWPFMRQIEDIGEHTWLAVHWRFSLANMHLSCRFFIPS